MKKSITLYLLIASVLVNIFVFMFYSKKVQTQQKKHNVFEKKMNDSATSVINKLIDADYFSLEKNQNAQDYFGNDNLDYTKLIPIVTNNLLEYNDNPKGNIYTGQEQLGTNKFIINKAKILNHRWIIADYSDGQIWGEVLLKYFVNKDQTISFEVIQSLLYQKS